MSPRIALTTACSGAPSKLKVDSPMVAAVPGRGPPAASWLMVRPLPVRIWACGGAVACSGSASTLLRTTGSGKRGVPSRFSSGTGVAHAASRMARVAARDALIRVDGFIGCTVRVLPHLCRRLRLLLLLRPMLPDERPAHIDPAPDRLGL